MLVEAKLLIDIDQKQPWCTIWKEQRAMLGVGETLEPNQVQPAKWLSEAGAIFVGESC